MNECFFARFADLLAPFLDDDLRGLEMFARNVLPGWTSWGNEVELSRTVISPMFVNFSGFEVSSKNLRY